MKPLTRREALVLGSVGMAGVVAGSAGLTWAMNQKASAPPNIPNTLPAEENSAASSDFFEPEIFKSDAGFLNVHISAAEQKVEIAGNEVQALTYNKGIPGPTLILRPGDLLKVTLENNLSEATNLHVHGLHVSPQGNSDNVFLTIESGDSFNYEYQLPDDHPPGVYWYHPHRHGSVADQVFGGLYGAIIVEDPSPISVSKERLIIISDISFNSSGQILAASQMDKMMGREGNLVLVNGQLKPHLSANPGERERWRIINACASRYLNLQLFGQQLQLLGIDSGRFENPKNVDEILLTPGNRADILITAAEGKTALVASPIERGISNGMMRGAQPPSTNTESVLLTYEVNGNDIASLEPVPNQGKARDLRNSTLTAHRELTFFMGMGMGSRGMSFTINGNTFDPDRIDTIVQAGSVEEWTLTNISPMDHPIHLHVWPMQIVEAQGRELGEIVWQDVVNVPANDSIRVRIPFDNFVGKTVYHCHVLDHEDEGMMGIIEVR